MDRGLILQRYNRYYAKLLFKLVQAQAFLTQWKNAHKRILIVGAIIFLLLSTFLFLMPYKHAFELYFSNDNILSVLRSLLGGIGAALIGATAIVFSLIVFSMQTNIERMPHGLFRKFGSDLLLLGSFLGSFVIAILVASMSLIPNNKLSVYAIFLSVWGVIAVLILFLYAYQRALKLINPITQLTLMYNAVRRDLVKWDRLATRAQDIMVNHDDDKSKIENLNEKVLDVKRIIFLKNNHGWETTAVQAINYCISYAKRYAELGDYDVSDYSFDRIMCINAKYCSVKRGTYIEDNPLLNIVDNSDAFINLSLEHLRQTMQTALARGDEKLASSTLRGMSGLYGVYLSIEYAGRTRSKHHAMLAAGYISSAVESVIPQNMADVMMEGIKLMGRNSVKALSYANASDIVGTIQKISMFSTISFKNTVLQPVTLTAFSQFSDINIQLIIKGDINSGFTMDILQKSISEAAIVFLHTEDTPINSRHSYILSPYYSVANVTGFISRIKEIVNYLIDNKIEAESSKVIIRNVEKWADKLYQSQKEVLLVAANKRSSFIYDLIPWNVMVCEVLLALSESQLCDDYHSEKLKKHSIWLIATLSWIPEEQEVVTFVNNGSLVDSIFEAAMMGLSRNSPEFYDMCKKILEGWVKKTAQHVSTRSGFEDAIKSLVALTVKEGTVDAQNKLLDKLKDILSKIKSPSKELRELTARHLLRNTKDYRYRAGFYSSVDIFLSQCDTDSTVALFTKVAEILNAESPKVE
ncbi:hypothetical protein OH793_08720 [Klebsiella aerogenes]|uniref:hypothetical protein n=1 Tax=Klebsiella aerogenes TaxID=548 RepID=UPI0013D32BD7|nr:hypothetical protein [Klebsiella aerogenes]MDA3991366.1 hypothetical protein [Klebsiella aerogenes]HBV4469265.1 hypothetical protein [Klebsiella aerogenes]HDS6594735.1 hypothetical protein [Klebsiella aerogenes]